MPSCSDLRSELSNLLDDEVPPELRRALLHHLAECRTCQILYDSTRRTIRIVTDVGAWDLPAEVSQRLTGRILAAIDKRD
jgi:anti-sigma factor RsiW